MFVDGQANTPKCRCKPDCEMPCWQLLGLTEDPCGACGCGMDALEFVHAVIQVKPGQPIPPGYKPMDIKRLRVSGDRYPRGAVDMAISALELAYSYLRDERPAAGRKIEDALDRLYRYREIETGEKHPYRDTVAG